MTRPTVVVTSIDLVPPTEEKPGNGDPKGEVGWGTWSMGPPKRFVFRPSRLMLGTHRRGRW